MSGRVNLLSALLALQLVIVAAVLFTESGFGERDEGPYLSFEAAAVDELRITGGDHEADPLILTRGADGWQLPNGLPANDEKVEEVLETLAGLRSPWPVATSGGAAARFEVTDDEFQRHVVLASGGEVVADVYLGTSPGYQQVHARRAGEDAVYSVGISNYQVPPDADDWLDKTLLQPRGEIVSVTQNGWTLSRGEEGWLLTGAGRDDTAPADQAASPEQGTAADQEKAAELVRTLAELRVSGIAEAPESPAEPDAVLAVTDDEGTYRLSLFGDEAGSQYRVQSDRREGWFKVAGYTAEQLVVERSALLPSEEDTGGEGDREPSLEQEAEPAQDAAPAGRQPHDAGE